MGKTKEARAKRLARERKKKMLKLTGEKKRKALAREKKAKAKAAEKKVKLGRPGTGQEKEGQGDQGQECTRGSAQGAETRGTQIQRGQGQSKGQRAQVQGQM